MKFSKIAVIVGLFAGIFGCVLGAIVAHFISWLVAVDVQTRVSGVRLGMVISISASFVAGIVPAWLGAGMDPAEALRHE